MRGLWYHFSPCYSICGPQTSRMSIPGELARDTESWALFQTCYIRGCINQKPKGLVRALELESTYVVYQNHGQVSASPAVWSPGSNFLRTNFLSKNILALRIVQLF